MIMTVTFFLKSLLQMPPEINAGTRNRTLSNQLKSASKMEISISNYTGSSRPHCLKRGAISLKNSSNMSPISNHRIITEFYTHLLQQRKKSDCLTPCKSCHYEH